MNDKELEIASWCLALAGCLLLLDHLVVLVIVAGHVGAIMASHESKMAFAEYAGTHQEFLRWSLGLPRLVFDVALGLAPVWAIIYAKCRRWHSSKRTPSSAVSC